MYIQAKRQEINALIDYLDNSIGSGTEEDFEKISELENIIGENPILIKYKCICLYNSRLIEDALNFLIYGLKKFQTSYDLHELLYEFLKYTKDYKGISYVLSQMYKLAENEGKKEEIVHKLEDYAINSELAQNELNKYFEMFKKECLSKDYRSYPIDEFNNSIIRQEAFPGRDDKDSYLVNLYKAIQKININSENRFNYLYEMIKGKFVNTNTDISVSQGDIIGISSANKQGIFTDITIMNLEDHPYNLKLEPNFIKYFNIKNNKILNIETNQDIFVSHFKKAILEDKPKLVLQIFIDGLSFQFVKSNDFKNMMPNTYEFFKNGYINNNCHANGEWTLPSLMSMCTGKYTTNHHVFHTDAPHKGEEINKFIQEYFYSTGYMTGRICSNWRGTPSYGYFKSTNRSIYSPMYERMYGGEIVMETLEHIEAFKNFSNYVWMTIEDLHGVADGLSRGVFQDISVEKYVNANISNDSDISVFRNYNEKKIEEYKGAIKRVDFYLGIVFDYIKKNYGKDEFVVTLNSDHGQKFIEKEDFMFTRNRTNVPFMMCGRNIYPQNSDELMSNVDIYPTLLKICGLQCDTPIDGHILKDFGGTEREYTISESIFPGQTYKLALNDKEHLCIFETKENTRNNGLIPIDEYCLILKNLKTGEDETDIYPEKVEKYSQVIFEHIKEWIAF